MHARETPVALHAGTVVPFSCVCQGASGPTPGVARARGRVRGWVCVGPSSWMAGHELATVAAVPPQRIARSAEDARRPITVRPALFSGPGRGNAPMGTTMRTGAGETVGMSGAIWV